MSRSTTRYPSLRYPGYGVLFVAWTLFACAAYARHLLFLGSSSVNVWLEFAGWLTSFYPWVLLSPLVFRLEQRLPLRLPPSWKHVMWLVLASVPLTWLACEVAMVAQHLLFRRQAPAPWWLILRCEFLMQQALYWLAVGGGCVLRNLSEHQEMQRQAAQTALEKSELESSLRQAQLDAMRMRLNPHFLFNSLQNISTLTRQDPETANRMLARLGDLLRSAIGKETEAETTLSTEIDLTKAYAAIEQMRFQDRLSVIFNVEPGLEQALVPTFLLQPLVENAITHGLRDPQRAGSIHICVAREKDQLVFSVRDNGAGFSQEKLDDIEMGIGLGATCDRLAKMYPDRHTISIQRLPEGGAEVSIEIPYRRRQSATQEATHELVAAADCR